MSSISRICIYVAIWWKLARLGKLVIVDKGGIRPDDVAPLSDGSTNTCTSFVATLHQYTQLFERANCSADQMSVTLVGRDMRCDQTIYVVGLGGADVDKSQNRWKTCTPRWQTTTDLHVDWCLYDCDCSAGCEQVMVLRWPNVPTESSWTLCDISQHCNGFCKDQSACYIYGNGSWDDGVDFCRLLHPNARMIEERSDDEGQKHIAEALAAGYTEYWIAGRRPPRGGRYVFYWNSSGTRLQYTKWHNNQPYSTSGGSDCIKADKTHNWKWGDDKCLKPAMYMCEIVEN